MENWISLSQTAGTGNVNITVTASSYTELMQRATSLTVSTRTKSAVVNIFQRTDDSFFISPNSFEFPETGGSVNIAVTCNTGWTITSLPSWISANIMSGTGNGTVILTAPTVAGDSRTGNIVFENSFGWIRTVSARQSFNPANNPLTFNMLESGNIVFKTTPSSYNLPDRTVKYSKNGVDWYVVSSTTGGTLISVQAGENVMFMNNNGDTLNMTTLTSSARHNLSGSISSIKRPNYDGDSIQNLFQGTNVVSAANLIMPDDMRGWNFGYLFSGCTNLTTPPSLPATTLYTSNCYSHMFAGCTSLATAPALPATTLVHGCYQSMFIDCTSLTTAPALPATTLAEYCYEYMFCRCTSLTSVPSLPATILPDYCYLDMFASCTSLTTAPVLSATTVGQQSCFGFLSYCTNLTTVPNLSFNTIGELGCCDMFSGCTSLATAPSLNSLTEVGRMGCKEMFVSCRALTTAPNLPATTLGEYCYDSMFEYCRSLTTAPALPATTLSVGCYNSMFFDCSALTNAPALPATTLAERCYSFMFTGCESLTTAPALPSTTLAKECYENMFSECTALTTAPVLSATTLVDSCYREMFLRCRSLTSITCLATDISANNCTLSWVIYIPSDSNKIFFKNSSMTAWTRGSNGIPSGWTVQDA